MRTFESPIPEDDPYRARYEDRLAKKTLAPWQLKPARDPDTICTHFEHCLAGVFDANLAVPVLDRPRQTIWVYKLKDEHFTTHSETHGFWAPLVNMADLRAYLLSKAARSQLQALTGGYRTEPVRPIDHHEVVDHSLRPVCGLKNYSGFGEVLKWRQRLFEQLMPLNQ